MTGKLNLRDLPFGIMNNIADGGGPSTDRRRTDPLEFLRLSTETAYGRNALRNKQTFEGIVVALRPITFPSVRSKGDLFKEYTAKSTSKKDPEDTTKNKSTSTETAKDYPSTVYKVYIPELEPRPAPRGTGDPILATYPDVYSDITSEISIGNLVRVSYEDVENLYNPRIVAITGGPVQIEGYSEQDAQSLKSKFSSAPSLPVNGAVPERKLLSSEIKNFADARPDYSGPTPNADKLRSALKKMGYKEKGTELSNAGDITATMADVGIEVFEEIKKQLPDVAIKATGGNDKYHKVIADAGMYRSRHVDGVALDFTFSPVNPTNKSAILKILQGYSAVNSPFRFKDEYKTLTSAASGQHFHFSFRAGTEGSEEQKEAQRLLASGEIVGYQIGDAA